MNSDKQNDLYDSKKFHWPGGPGNVFVCYKESALDPDGYIAYTDGSADTINDIRPGGSAYIIMKDEEIIRARNKQLIGTTINRAELLAIVSAVKYCPTDMPLHIYTDSQYCIGVLSGKDHGKANLDLIKMFRQFAKNHQEVVFHWVRGHSGDAYNEMVDDMAFSAYTDVLDAHGLKPDPRWRDKYKK